MFESFRRLADAVEALQGEARDIRIALEEQAENTLQSTELASRLSAIEVGYARWTAEADAVMLKADALFKNARNSEERARDAQKKSAARAETGVEDEADMRRAYEEMYGDRSSDIQPDDVEPGEWTNVPGRPTTQKNNRLRAKFR